MKSIRVFYPSLIVLMSFLMSVSFSNAQTYSSTYISYTYIQIIEYSITITYSQGNGNYTPSQTVLGFYADNLAYKQAKYDANRNRVSLEYGRLDKLQLINEANQKTLQDYKNVIIPYIDTYSGNVDYSSDATTEEWISYISQPFRNTYIRDEILLLQKCKREIDHLKNQYPTAYSSTLRYHSISKMLEALRTCSQSEISSLNWIDFENVSTTTTNSSYQGNTAKVSLPAYCEPGSYKKYSSTVTNATGDSRANWIIWTKTYLQSKECSITSTLRLNEKNQIAQGNEIKFEPVNESDWVVQFNTANWRVYHEFIYPTRIIFQVKSSLNKIHHLVVYIEKDGTAWLMKQDVDPNTDDSQYWQK